MGHNLERKEVRIYRPTPGIMLALLFFVVETGALIGIAAWLLL
jgi:hypothetical protein